MRPSPLDPGKVVLVVLRRRGASVLFLFRGRVTGRVLADDGGRWQVDLRVAPTTGTQIREILDPLHRGSVPHPNTDVSSRDPTGTRLLIRSDPYDVHPCHGVTTTREGSESEGTSGVQHHGSGTPTSGLGEEVPSETDS